MDGDRNPDLRIQNTQLQIISTNIIIPALLSEADIYIRKNSTDKTTCHKFHPLFEDNYQVQKKIISKISTISNNLKSIIISKKLQFFLKTN